MMKASTLILLQCRLCDSMSNSLSGFSVFTVYSAAATAVSAKFANSWLLCINSHHEMTEVCISMVCSHCCLLAKMWIVYVTVLQKRVPLNNKWSKNFDKRPSHRGRVGFFTGDNVMWHQPVRSIAVSSSSPAVMPLLSIEGCFSLHAVIGDWMVLFAAYTAAETCNAFQWARKPTDNVPFPWEILTPSNMWFLGPTRVGPPYLDQFSCFCTAHLCDEHTDRHILLVWHLQQ